MSKKIIFFVLASLLIHGLICQVNAFNENTDQNFAISKITNIGSLQYSLHGQDVTLFWNPPSDIEGLIGYNVYRGDILLTPAPITVTFFTDCGVPFGIHTYRVDAVYEYGVSLIGEITMLVSPILPPEELTWELDIRNVTLAWQHPTPFSELFVGYYVFLNDMLLTIEPIKTNSFTHHNAPLGWQTYSVAAVYEHGISEPISVQVLVEIIHSFYLYANVENNNVELFWTISPPPENNDSFIGYNVYRNFELLTIEPAKETSYEDFGVPYGIYTYRVYPVFTEGYGISQEIVVCIEPLLPPINIVVYMLEESIFMLWEPSSPLGSSFMGYNVYLEETKINDELLLETTFSIDEKLKYPLLGVSAVYAGGESEIIYIDINPFDFDENAIPMQTELLGNYPNPFNPDTNIRFSVAVESIVSIDIFNLKGQKVRTLVNSYHTVGNHSVVWLGNDDHERPVSSGVYFYQMKTEDFTQTKRMILLK